MRALPSTIFEPSSNMEKTVPLGRLNISGIFMAGILLSSCMTDDTRRVEDSYGSSSQAVELGGTHWQLVELISSDESIGTVRPGDPTQYEMHLNADGTVNLKLDCNRANGPWSSMRSADGASGGFNIGPVVMTRAMCGPGSLDQRISRELQSVRSYTLGEGRLNLSLTSDTGIQVWEPIDLDQK